MEKQTILPIAPKYSRDWHKYNLAKCNEKLLFYEFLYFRDNQKEFMESYHRRSNVETTFSMIKMRLGEPLKSKNYVAQRNELMLKFISHNICGLIQEMYNHNLKINFKKCLRIYVEQKVPIEIQEHDSGKVQNQDF